MTAVTGRTDRTETTPERQEVSPAQTLERTLNQALGSVRADAVFGRQVEKGTTTLIPCAEVMVGMGMGGGRGVNQGATAQQTGEGEGIGGGGGGRGRPVAVIVVGPDGVRVRPVVDVTRLALAGMTTAGFMAFWVARLTAASREGKRGAGPTSLGKLTKALRR